MKNIFKKKKIFKNKKIIISFFIFLSLCVIFFISFSIYKKINKMEEQINKVQEEKEKIIEEKNQLSEEKENIENVAQKNEEKAQSEMEKRMKEEVARAQAQTLAEQEKNKRVELEEDYDDFKTEQEELDEDKDKDGLTAREEEEAGTSDEDYDSDGDGIIDGLDKNPAGGGKYDPQIFYWSYYDTDWEYKLNIHEDWYYYYSNKPRIEHGITYVTYYDENIKKIANKLTEGAEKNGLSKAAFAVSFIQGLPYIEDYYTGYNEYPKYPVETLIDKNGDCEDVSYLTASILTAMNLDPVLVILPGHMAIGIWSNCDRDGAYYKIGDRCYFYTETTASDWSIGDIPSEYELEKARIIKLDGTEHNVYPMYNIPCEYSSDFIGYYEKNNKYYNDSECTEEETCLIYYNEGEIYYWDTYDSSFYWDKYCNEKIIRGCTKAIYYPGLYFKSDDSNYYHDNYCTKRADPSY